MKKTFLLLFSFFLLIELLPAQPPRDTAWGSWPQQEYYTGESFCQKVKKIHAGNTNGISMIILKSFSI